MKRFFSVALIAVLCLLLLLPTVFAAGKTYVVDNGALLTESERASLEAQAQRLASANACDFYVLTVSSLGGKSAPDYAEDYADRYGLGYGGTDDCILLVVCLPEREFGFTGTGVGYYVLTEDVKADLEDLLADGLRSGTYAQAFSSFLDVCAGYVPEARQWQARAESPDEDADRAPEDTTGRTIAGAVAAPTLGFLFSGIPVASMKRKNSNVSKKRAATVYEAAGGINFAVCEDRYVRTDTTRVHIEPSDSNRGGGGSVGVGGGHISGHTSSSGVSHSSGGGKF